MAFEKITPQDLQNKGVIGLADTPGLDTSAMQHKFDEIALDVIVPAFNDLIDELDDAGYDPETGDLMHRAVYDSDNDGIVDNAEKVNNHTVEEDVPEGAVFTDTTYSAGDNITISEENEISATVPTKTSDLTNDSGFITSADVPTKTSDLTNDSGFITASDIPAIPSKTSDLTNDSGFITSSAVPTKTSQLTNDSGFITASSVPSDIDDLDDVAISYPSTGQALCYNSSTQKWENMDAGTGDMTKAVYDSDNAVATAGGIKSFLSDYAKDADLTKAFLDIAVPFSASDSYSVGDYVIYEKYLYRCTTNHSGVWNSSHFSQVEMGNELAFANGQIASISSAISGLPDKMDKDGDNAASYVKFSGSFTVGDRASGTVGGNSFSAGSSNLASAAASFTEGYGNIANGRYSHAAGRGTTAGYEKQFIVGEKNDNKSTTLFEVGNGSVQLDISSNAFEVYSDGKISQDNGTTKFKFTRYNNEDGYYDASGTFHAFSSGGGGSSSLAGLDDVSLSSQTDGQVLAYDNTSSKWKNVSLGTASKKDVPASGNATSSQVVMGNDTRLSDARTPVSHTHTVSQITDFPTIPQGDMEASDYDPNGTVATAGGIVAYIDATITAALTASY